MSKKITTVRSWMLGTVCALLSGTAHAQRADDNAAIQAEDAFGTSVGNERIGLYSSGNVRGFDPVQAGNARLEGLYFDRQADTSDRITRSSTVHVGISAQSYPFPAPTGIVDYHLRLPGDKQVFSALGIVGPYGHYKLETDAQIPLVAEKLSLGAGVGGIHENWPYGAKNAVWTIGGMLRWRPSDNIEIIPLAAMVRRSDYEGFLTVVTAGAFLPPRIKRGIYYGQDWADWDTRQTTLGFVSRATFGDGWTLRAGLFNSLNYREHQGENVFRNTQPDGTTDRFAVISPSNKLGSTSGEIRLSRVFNEGPRRHTVHAMLRGRDKTRVFGGSLNIPLRPGVLGVEDQEPRPASFVFGPTSRSHVTQGTAGLAYEGMWRQVGEVGFNLQKTSYKRVTNAPTLAPVISKDSPWLFSATAAIYATSTLAVYGSYTRGLEESSEAPAVAINRGEPVDASRTSQMDAGLRYAITPRLRLVAGLFQVKKPFFNLDSANVFTRLGQVRHRGAEFSLTGQPFEGVNVVAGTVLLQARVSGEPVTSGRIGRVPLGQDPRVSLLNIQYGPPAWQGFSLDGEVENQSSHYVDIRNTVRQPGLTTLDIGARYRFRVAGVNATLRVLVVNLTNEFRWNVNPSGSFQYNNYRQVSATLTADF